MENRPVMESPPAAAGWETNTITPVVNPAYFDDPMIRNELRPVFGYQTIDDGFYTQGGNAWSLGVHVSVALSERLAFNMNRGGYLAVNPAVGVAQDGWLDLAGGLKYALIDDQESQFLLTPGFSFQAPTGSLELLQGDKSSEFNFFLSSEKGFGDCHLIGNVSLRAPVDGDARSSILGCNLHADYFASRWFIPFVVGSAWTVVSDGMGPPLGAEGYDIYNFGASGVSGTTQATMAVGFRTRLANALDFGVAYQKAIAEPKGFFDDRVQMDICIRF
jgi:hypothetical protein